MTWTTSTGRCPSTDFVDWSGNCGNLSTAAGAFAIHAGLVEADRIPDHGVCVVRIWQANIGKTIIAHVPVAGGQVQETGGFELDGVTFPAAEIVLEFMTRRMMARRAGPCSRRAILLTIWRFQASAPSRQR
ncbi:MAG: PrpF domain-containing protein [Paenacidovorax caeni]